MYHIKADHFTWNYLYFIVHLKTKDKTDFNGTESAIHNMLESDTISWFPNHKSLRHQKYLEAKKMSSEGDNFE